MMDDATEGVDSLLEIGYVVADLLTPVANERELHLHRRELFQHIAFDYHTKRKVREVFSQLVDSNTSLV